MKNGGNYTFRLEIKETSFHRYEQLTAKMCLKQVVNHKNRTTSKIQGR